MVKIEKFGEYFIQIKIVNENLSSFQFYEFSLTFLESLYFFPWCGNIATWKFYHVVPHRQAT